MRSSTNRSLLLCLALLHLAGWFLVSALGGCAKEEEEKIMITLQTEALETSEDAAPAPPPTESPPPPEAPPPTETPASPEASPPADVKALPAPVSPPPASPPTTQLQPVTPKKAPKKVHVAKQAATRTPPRPSRTAPPTSPQETGEAKTLAERQKEAFHVSGLQPIAPSETAQQEQALRFLIQRQRLAFQMKDVTLYLNDLAVITPKIRKSITDFFAQHETILVEFSGQTFSVQGNRAEVSMIQKASLRPKGENSAKATTAKVGWQFVKQNGTWKISETKILEKYR